MTKSINSSGSFPGCAYFTAHTYDMAYLKEHFGNQKIYGYGREVLGISLAKPNEMVFFFSFGAMVFWGVSAVAQEQFLKRLKTLHNKRMHPFEKEEFTFTHTSNTVTQIQDGFFSLASEDVKEKAAISYALGQSVKLAFLERSMEALIAETQFIPKELAEKGKISLSRRDISKEIGRIFMQKSDMNLQSDLLDTPDLVWESSDIAPQYYQVNELLEVSERVELLNRRLDMVQEIYTLLSTELQHQHSAFLEWVIIILIAIEIALVLLKDVFHLI